MSLFQNAVTDLGIAWRELIYLFLIALGTYSKNTIYSYFRIILFKVSNLIERFIEFENIPSNLYSVIKI